MNTPVTLQSKAKVSVFHWFAVVAVLLVSFFFGIEGILMDSIRRDELTTIGHIGGLDDPAGTMSLIDTVNSLTTHSTQHPPLFFLMENIWSKIFGYDYRVLRVLALLWGMLALAMVYRLAKDLGGQHVALITIALMATSVMFVFYLHEIRQYTSLIFWNALVWLMYHRLHRRKSEPRFYELIITGVAVSAAAYTHVPSIFLLLVIGIYHVLFVKKNKRWWKISFAFIIGGATFLPYVPVSFTGLNVILDEYAVNDAKVLYNNDLIGLVPVFWGNGHLIVFIALSAIGLYSVVTKRRNSWYVLYFCLAFIGVVLAMNGYLEFIKRIRYVIISLIPFFILASMGFVALFRWQYITTGFLVIWIALGTWFQLQDDYLQNTGLDGALDHPEYYALMPALEENMSPDDILIMTVNDYEAIQPSKQGKKSIEQYYFDGSGFTFIRLNSFPGAGDVNINDIINAISGRPVWVTHRYDASPEELEFLAGIADDYHLCRQLTYGETSILDYYIPNDAENITCTAE